MNTPLPNWSEPIAEADVTIDGKTVKLVIRASKPFRAWLESVEATLTDISADLAAQAETLADHETRIEALEP